MTKKMIVSVAYQQFACEPADAIRLLEIGARMVKVDRDHFDDPYRPAADQPTLMSSAEMADYDDTPFPAQPAAPIEPAPAPDQPF